MAELTAGANGLRQLQGLKDVPLLRQLALFAGFALAIALGLSLFNWSQKPAFVPLYPGLSDKDSADLADSLRAAGIEYRVETDGVSVAPDQVHAARLRAAAQGLPKGGASGFEMIQQDQGFGVSQFIENARYQLALETELARTVASLQPVKHARVHLAVPKPSAFTSQKNGGASASVVVELQAGRQLEGNQVDSIRHIVASSVPGLAPTSVTVIDQLGRLLGDADPDDGFAQSTEQYQYARRAEADYVRRIESLLAPMLGASHISAQVAADIDFAVVEEAREVYNPDGTVVRNEQITQSTRSDGRGDAVGIPGATSNQPPAQDAAKDGKTRVATQTRNDSSENRSYEVDRTLSHVRQAQGRLKRLSIAVLVDNIERKGADGKMISAPLTAAELAKVEALTQKAVGFDAARGDTVTVQNAPFIVAPPAPLEETPIWQRADIRDYARQGLGAIIVLVLILAVLRPMLRSLIHGRPATPRGAAPTTVEAINGETLPADSLSLSSRAPLEQSAPAALPASQYEERLTAARQAVAQDPKRVAQVMKTWLNEEG